MIKQNKPLQELQMLSRSLSDCQSLSLKVMIRVSLFVWNSQLCDRVAESYNVFVFVLPIGAKKGPVSKTVFHRSK